MFVNKESSSFEVDLNLPKGVTTITAIYLNVNPSKVTTPLWAGDSLTATDGIRIQEGVIGVSSGLVGMNSSYDVASGGDQATVYVPPKTAVLVKAS